jgi:hypothetical protein
MALQVIFMDAGQGDATLLIYPDGSLVLVDCGCIMNNGVVTKGIKTLLEEHLAKTGTGCGRWCSPTLTRTTTTWSTS